MIKMPEFGVVGMLTAACLLLHSSHMEKVFSEWPLNGLRWFKKTDGTNSRVMPHGPL